MRSDPLYIQKRDHLPISPKVTFSFHERSLSHFTKGQPFIFTKGQPVISPRVNLPKVIFSHLPISSKVYQRLSPNGQVKPLTSRHSPPPNWRIPRDEPKSSFEKRHLGSLICIMGSRFGIRIALSGFRPSRVRWKLDLVPLTLYFGHSFFYVRR